MPFGIGSLIAGPLAQAVAPNQQPLAQSAAGISALAGPSAVGPALAQAAAASGEEPPTRQVNQEQIQRILAGLGAVQTPETRPLPAPPPIAPAGNNPLGGGSLQALLQIMQRGGGGGGGARPRIGALAGDPRFRRR